MTFGSINAPITNAYIPMGHVAAVADLSAIPVIGGFLPLKVTGIYRTINVVTDMDIRASFTLPLPIPLVSFGLEAGYRQQTITTGDAADFLTSIGITAVPSINFDYSGYYFGANLSF